MNRCRLITLDVENRVGSINLDGYCNQWEKCVDLSSCNIKFKEFPNIELDEVYPEDILKFKNSKK